MTAGIDLRYMYSKWWSFAKHNWCGEWNQDTNPDQAHVGILTLVHRIKLFGYMCPILDMKVWAQQVSADRCHVTSNGCVNISLYSMITVIICFKL